MSTARAPHLVETRDLEDYPLGREDRLDSHYFLPWERRRWLNSEMRLKGPPECRAIYFDLICASYDQAPVGTLPDDVEQLAKLAQVPEGHFRALCALEYGPLYKWRPCLSEGERRIYHPMVLRTVLEALSRREDNRARNDAANAKKRRQRLRGQLAGYTPELAKNDAALRFIDEWLLAEGCEYRTASWVERGMAAWSNHILDLQRRRI